MITNNPLTQKFDEIFEKKLKGKIPHHRAYQEAEEEFESEHGHTKYSSFESFRISRSRRINKKNKKR
jgi:hypothetical protein